MCGCGYAEVVRKSAVERGYLGGTLFRAEVVVVDGNRTRGVFLVAGMPLRGRCLREGGAG